METLIEARNGEGFGFECRAHQNIPLERGSRRRFKFRKKIDEQRITRTEKCQNSRLILQNFDQNNFSSLAKDVNAVLCMFVVRFDAYFTPKIDFCLGCFFVVAKLRKKSEKP